jgi:adenine-specific DNA-methyltransferase
MKPFATQDQNDEQGPETRSADLVGMNVEALKGLFPEAFTEGRIDFEVLKQLLGGTVDERDEKYGLNWHGKRQARQLALTPSTGTLRPAPDDSVDWDNTQNLMIEGDNLEVLKLLQKSYASKAKMIYIDPPYNTGGDFVYPDNFYDSIGNYLRITSQVDTAGGKLTSNPDSSGRFHTDWLTMMYPRLMLAKTLLKKDGVILVAIDDGEVHHLRLLLDSVFGMENFIGSFIWEGGRKNDARLISLGHDYTLVYANSFSLVRDNQTKWRERKLGLDEIYAKEVEIRSQHGEDYEAMHKELLVWFRELPDEHPAKAHDHFSYVDARGIYFPDNLRSPNPRPNLVFDWKGYKPHPNGWAYGKEKMAELDEADRLYYPASIEQRLKIKSYLKEHETWAPGSVFYKDRRASSKALTSLMGAEVFDFPKDAEVMARFVRAITTEDDLIVDFFAGSGSTAHGVLSLNRESSSKRRYLIVQLPEPLDAENKDQAAAAAYCDKIGKPRLITELTKERMRLAATNLKADNPMFAGDYGFRVFKLDSTNIRPWEPNRDKLAETLEDSVEHIKAGRIDQDILFEILLKLGLELTVPIETRSIASKTVYSVGLGTLLVCLAESIQATEVESLALGIVDWHTALAPAVESTVVFRDSAFADDVAKTNLTAILAQHGLENVRSL